MTGTKPAGPSLDAELAETMGLKVFVRPYSTDIGAAIAAAEEMRKAGRVYWWSAGAATFQEATNYTATVSGANTLRYAGGASVAHALTLALLAALR